MGQHATEPGNATRTSAGTTAILAAPGAGVRYRIKSIAVTIHTVASSGKVVIDDGTTEWFGWDAITAGSGQPPMLNFPDGLEWGKNLAINLTTVGAITAFAVVVVEKRGQ
jgi:hypothetical protein